MFTRIPLLKTLLLSAGLLLAGGLHADNDGNSDSAYSKKGTQTCLSCHDFSADSPVHPMMEGAHGDRDNPNTPMAQKGCEHCHGPSAAHSEKPTDIKPGISFGPRWGDSTADQSQACLQCHQNDTAHDWPTALHQEKGLTCASCHDLHTTDQAVLDPIRQVEVCTTCHKVQKKGIHHLSEKKPENPGCVTCHDPHADPSPVIKLLANRSEGCRSCHDFRAMQKSPQVSDRAKQYHRAMASKDKTCVDCHRGVVHAPPGSFPPPVLGGLSEADVDLFFPGRSDMDWILGEHAGAQNFRQGRNCQQCHGGDQLAMGEKIRLENNSQGTGSVDSHLQFAIEGDRLRVTISWRGAVTDSSVAVMIDDGSDDEFGRAGCWASCHSDMPGMHRDRGLQQDKYLSAARQPVHKIGRAPRFKDDGTLSSMNASGHYVEQWRARLQGGELSAVESSRILAGRQLDSEAVVTASARHANGEWSVSFYKPLRGSGKAISAGKQYTLGYAIHAGSQSEAQHWVSLPMTLSVDSLDSDFTLQPATAK